MKAYQRFEENPIMAIPATPTIPAVTSAQNSTAAATDLTTTEALANANKAQGNAAQVDIANLHTVVVGLKATVDALATAVANLSTGGDDQGQDSIVSKPTYTGGDNEVDGADPLGPSH